MDPMHDQNYPTLNPCDPAASWGAQSLPESQMHLLGM